MFDTLIKNGRVVLADREETLDIGIRDGRIAALAPNIDTACAREMVDASGQYVMPGMVDAHMHVSEPGRTEWEGYETGTQAMVAGGITSFVEMPLNTIPATTNVETLELKLRTAEGKCWADYAPMGGLVPWNLDDLAPLADAGVAAFKAFVATCGSGKPGDFKNVTDFELYEGCRRIAQKDGLLVVHCENATITDGLGKAARAAGLTKLSDYVASRPIFTEVEAVHRVLLIAEAAAFTSHTALAPRWSRRSSGLRFAALTRASSPAHTISCSALKSLTLSVRRPNVHLRFATAVIRKFYGRCSPMMRSKCSSPTILRAPST